MRDLDVWIAVEVDELAGVEDAWRRLARTSGNPFMGPDWTLAWWRCAAPERGRLAVGVAMAGEDLVGIAPCYTPGGSLPAGRLQMLGLRTGQMLEPLARPGMEPEVAGALGTAFLDHGTSSLELEWINAYSPWPERLARHSGAGGEWRVLQHFAIPSPVVELTEGGYEHWLSTRSKSLRKDISRRARRFSEAGGDISRVSPRDAGPALESLVRLNRERWASLGRPPTISPAMERLLLHEGRRLTDAGVLALWDVRCEGRSIGIEAALTAGRRVSLWQGGFDPDWSRLAPSRLAIAAVIEHASAGETTEVDLGPGAQAYKEQLATAIRQVRRVTLIRRDARYPLTWTRLAPRRARERIGARIPPALRERIKARLRSGS